MMNLINKYNQLIEKWNKSNIYNYNPEESNSFSIDTPPPTISGVLHIGHVFSYCHTDFIARFQRMKGENVFYPIGFDCNGLPTEKLVEKKYNKRAKDYSVNEKPTFEENCQTVINESIPQFRNLFEKIGLSIDYNLQYNTMDKRCQDIAITSFKDLQSKDLIYQAYKPVFWDWIDGTATAQAEIEDKEFEGEMHDIVFKTEDGQEIIIATTRPEMLLSCFCVFAHPDDLGADGRYTNLNDKFLITPLYNKKVPVLPDEDVVKDKGTGIMMCCGFGDELDLRRYEKYSVTHPQYFPSLDQIDFPIEKSGFINQKALSVLSNLEKEKYKTEEFRKLIVEELKNKSLLKNSTKVTQIIKCAERSGAKLEIIPTKQWYIKIIEHKDKLMEVAQSINWLPKEMFEKIKVWIENLRHDWCISRDRYWGIKIPNDENNQVFDTWFTSSLTNVINSLYGKKFDSSNTLQIALESNLVTMDLRPQAHEIIRTWAFYTITKSKYHFEKQPWKNVMISGWCLAKDGGKMSKSKGNIIDPIKLLETFEPDAIRYWSANSNLGADSRYDENLIKIGNKLINKLTNVVNFIQLLFKKVETPKTNSLGDDNIENFSEADWQERNKARYRCAHQVPCILKNPDQTKVIDLIDIWILNKFVHLVDSINDHFENFDYSKALEVTEKFFWSDFCDNYIEICKTRAYGEHQSITDSGYISTLTTLAIIVPNILRILAPFLPFTTENLYLTLLPEEISIHSRGNWIKDNQLSLFKQYQYGSNGEILIQILEEVRKYKGNLKLSIKTPISLDIYTTDDEEITILDQIESDLKFVSNIDSLKVEKFANQEFDSKIEDKIYLKFALSK